MNKFAILVEKATSDLLIDPDWAVNLEICDSLNSNPLYAKDAIKAVKRRLGNRNPKIQLFALMLLEMLVKNCGEHVHCQVLEANILQEMIKMAQKTADTKVRHKVLMLVQAWKEAFGCPGGKFPQFFCAYNELRRSGLEFPQPSQHSVPIFTPPARHVPVNPQFVYGVPAQVSMQSNETRIPGPKSRSLVDMKSAWHVMSVLDEILDATNPHDRQALGDEMIMDLVNQCHVNHKRIMRLVDVTVDEVTLKEALSLSDNLQRVLANYDAITSDSFLSSEQVHSTLEMEVTQVPHEAERVDKIEVGVSSQLVARDKESPTLSSNQHDQSMGHGKIVTVSPLPSEPVSPFAQFESRVTSVPYNEKKTEASDNEDDDDEFAQLARRNLRARGIFDGSGKTASSQVSHTHSNLPPSSDADKGQLVVVERHTQYGISQDRKFDMIDYTGRGLQESQMQIAPIDQKTEHHAAEVLQPCLPQLQQLNSRQMPTNNYVVPWALEDLQCRVSLTAMSTNQLAQSSSPQTSSLNRPVYLPPPWELKIPTTIPRLVPSHPLYRTKSSFHYPDTSLTESLDYLDLEGRRIPAAEQNHDPATASEGHYVNNRSLY